MSGLDSPIHIALVVVVLLLVFGAKRLPEIGKSLGSGIREFKQSVTGESEHAALGAGTQPQPQPQQQSQPPQFAASTAPAVPAQEAPMTEPVPAGQAEHAATRVA